MTQPPDDRTPPPSEPVEPTEPAGDEAPEESGEGTVAPDAPTVAWTPPTGAPEEASTATPEAPTSTTDTDPNTDAAATAPTPASPIISAEPSTAPATGWAVPGTPPPVPTAAGGGGWEVPTGQSQTLLTEGYVVGGVGARFVAWLIDSLLSSLVPGALFLFLFDWSGMFQRLIDQMRFDENGRLIPGATYNYALPVTLEVALLYLILVGVQFLYFVGFWTGRWQATPGMIGLKMRVVDATTGTTLTLLQATKRWFAMGWWLSLLVLVPALQAVASLAPFAVNVFIFFSTIGNDRRQGFHDKFANSQVIRSVTSGSGATIVGCLVFGVMAILVSIVASVALFAVVGPQLFDMVQRMPRYQP